MMKMLQPSRYSTLRIDREPFTRPWGVFMSIVLYFLCAALFILLGLLAPTMFLETNTPRDSGAASLEFTLVLTEMQRLNELLYTKTRLQLPAEVNAAIGTMGEISVGYVYTVNMWGNKDEFWASLECPNGCASCPQGDSTLGISCHPVIVDSAVSDVVRCQGDKEWCSWTQIVDVDFVVFKTYYMNVNVDSSLGALDFGSVEEGTVSSGADFDVKSWLYQINFSYMNPDWVRFQAHIFYSFVLISLLAMFTPRIGFFYEVIRINRRLRRSLRWSRQQQWTAILLVCILFFNNPFYALELTGSSPLKCANLYTFFFATFIAILLLYWLVLMGDVVTGQQRRFSQGTASGPGGEVVRHRKDRWWCLKSYGWTMLNIFFIWLFIILIRIRVRLNDAGMIDSSTMGSSLQWSNSGIQGTLLAFTVLYSLRLGWLAAKAFGRLKNGPPCYFWVFLLSLFTAAFVVFVLCTGAISKNHYSALLFCTFYGCVNIYILSLAFYFTPLGSYIGLGRRETSGALIKDRASGLANGSESCVPDVSVMLTPNLVPGARSLHLEPESSKDPPCSSHSSSASSGGRGYPSHRSSSDGLRAEHKDLGLGYSIETSDEDDDVPMSPDRERLSPSGNGRVRIRSPTRSLKSANAFI